MTRASAGPLAAQGSRTVWMNLLTTGSCGALVLEVASPSRLLISSLGGSAAGDFYAVMHGARTRRWKSTTCPSARGGPARCSPSSPRTPAPTTWSTPPRHSEATQAREAITFCDHWKQVSGKDPATLVMDQKVTTQPVLGELDARGVRFLTLRTRSPALTRHIARLQRATSRP